MQTLQSGAADTDDFAQWASSSLSDAYVIPRRVLLKPERSGSGRLNQFWSLVARFLC